MKTDPKNGKHARRGPHEGDSIEVAGLPGNAPRRGQILEVLGEGEHVRYRVRWDERHESVFFPTEEGVHTIHGA